MVRRLTLERPDPHPFKARDGRPIRWLAVSDDPDPALDHAINRADIGAFIPEGARDLHGIIAQHGPVIARERDGGNNW